MRGRASGDGRGDWSSEKAFENGEDGKKSKGDDIGEEGAEK